MTTDNITISRAALGRIVGALENHSGNYKLTMGYVWSLQMVMGAAFMSQNLPPHPKPPIQHQGPNQNNS